MLVDAPNLVMGGVDEIDTFNPIDLLGLPLQNICNVLQADVIGEMYVKFSLQSGGMISWIFLDDS